MWNIKNTFCAVGTAMLLPLAAGEMEHLQKVFAKENAGADKVFQEAESTVDLTAAAGYRQAIAEKQLFRALDCKLRQTADPAARMVLLRDFYRLSREIQSIADTPREDMGSSAGMMIYGAMADLMQHRTAVLLLTGEQEKCWQRIAGASLLLKGQNIVLKQGRGSFDAKMYGREVVLQIHLRPRDVFRFQNRVFAVIRTDIAFSGNDDFSTVYLCELRNGQLSVYAQCEFPLISGWSLTQDTVVFTNHSNQKQKIQLR